ncbi:WbqC family protein [Paenibacillus sp. FJAT-26967]|uniref:WbqC family protein n=1 Tax=Paenibacillus sp. FJAT-26967 TaxID=1729690 RepID=UPI00083917A8|nr:WbqC family protein [Paenibacillus sp. FJAT-26967]
MKVAIMQPYFLPYIGYFQLIHAVDVFVVYDNIQYTKKGWINRNRFLQNGKDSYFSVAVQKDSDYLNVNDRTIALDFNRNKPLNQIREAYKKAPNFVEGFKIFENVVLHEDTNLFNYIYYSLDTVVKKLNIETKIVVSSSINMDHSLKSQDKVLAICKELGAHTYMNAIGGKDLYSKEEFAANGVELCFVRSKPIQYKQFDQAFVPWLSIIDVMMFNDWNTIIGMLEQYEVIR